MGYLNTTNLSSASNRGKASTPVSLEETFGAWCVALRVPLAWPVLHVSRLSTNYVSTCVQVSLQDKIPPQQPLSKML